MVHVGELGVREDITQCISGRDLIDTPPPPPPPPQGSVPPPNTGYQQKGCDFFLFRHSTKLPLGIGRSVQLVFFLPPKPPTSIM
jgi:hypothetical protein